MKDTYCMLCCTEIPKISLVDIELNVTHILHTYKLYTILY